MKRKRERARVKLRERERVFEREMSQDACYARVMRLLMEAQTQTSEFNLKKMRERERDNSSGTTGREREMYINTWIMLHHQLTELKLVSPPSFILQTVESKERKQHTSSSYSLCSFPCSLIPISAFICFLPFFCDTLSLQVPLSTIM